MIFTVDKNSGVTVYEQILAHITGMIENGTLKSGDRLPSTRELADTLGLSRSTVTAAYDELWAMGYIESTPGSYTTVRKREQAAPGGEEEKGAVYSAPDIYRGSLDLPYDPIMYYLENGDMIEKGKINFLQLSPDTRLLNMTHVKACMRDALNEKEADPFAYTHARGYPGLRMEIVKHMGLHGIRAEDRNVLVTNSTLQSLQLIFQVFSRPGDIIAIENPVHSVTLLFIKIFGLKMIEIPMTAEGMDLELLEKTLIENPVRFIYTMPTYQNPTGISMPRSRREELLGICANRDCIIIEDSIEEEMKYSGKALAPLKSIDTKGQVIYLGTFAKVLAPGLRIGWIIAEPECIKKLAVLKSILDISSGTINQIFLYNFFRKGAFELYLRRARKVLKKRMRTAVNALKKYVPPEKIEWNEPDGGYMIWVRLLTSPMENIEKHFADYGVMVHNGKYFFVKEPASNYIRICISRTDEVEIEEGMKRIGMAVEALPRV